MNYYEELIKLLDNAYAPISNFRVSAIITTKDGRCFKGVNVEDASTRAGICAERNAICNAITCGVKKSEFDSIYLMVDENNISTPCFVCRQLITEFFDENSIIHCYSKDGKIVTYKVNELCPHPFDENDLNRK